MRKDDVRRLFQPREATSPGRPNSSLPVPMRGYKTDRVRFFTAMHSRGTRQQHKLNQEFQAGYKEKL